MSSGGKIDSVCAGCGGTFRARRVGQKYCSHACYVSHRDWKSGPDHPQFNSIEKACAFCGKIFTAHPGEIKMGKGKYCSRACSNMDNAKRRPVWNKGRRAGEDRVCGICGKTYYASPARMKNESKYCSRECFSESKRRVIGTNHPLYRKQDVECFNCGKAIKRIPAKLALYEHPFCSRRCVGAYVKSHQPERTSIEIAMRDELTAAGIAFTEQYAHAYGVADFFIEPNLIVECDGDYWHKIPKVAARDRSKDKTLGADGFNVIRFWEKDIHANPAGCVNAIRQQMLG